MYVFPDGYDTFSHLSMTVTGDFATTSSNGVVKLNAGWNMVAINVPNVKVNEYFIQSVGAEHIEVATTYIDAKWLGFVPGVTNVLNDGNFLCVRDDDGVEEIQPFLCKVKPSGEGILFSWNSEDGV